MSRLLILQSKRMLLHSLQRRYDETGNPRMLPRIDRLRMEADRAQHHYRSSMLRLGSPDHADYWVIAYSRLIEMGEVLSGKLRTAAVDLAPDDRYEVSADVEMLEAVVDRWRESMRLSMAGNVA